ncbi:MAG TPA: ATP-binding cassette domain-containing protein, partial [Polyangiaceae bacterium]|nr:ATP-binding cassette domain-containing protein [Polyangiaceae bacterium]
MTRRAPKVELSALTASFGGAAVLRDVSFQVEKGEIAAIIGPSGSGKSTLLRVVNRMHELAPGATVSGRVLLDGADVYAEDVDPTELRRRVGVVLEHAIALPGMSIRRDVLAGYSLSGLVPSAPDELLETTLRRVGLWDEVKDRLGAPSASLDGGQIQRLAIARALAMRPTVLLLDEPSRALDPAGTAHVEELMNELRSQITILLVTANLQ